MMRTVFLAEDSGHLYTDGGWSSQPEWFVDAVEIYRDEKCRAMKNQSVNSV